MHVPWLHGHSAVMQELPAVRYEHVPAQLPGTLSIGLEGYAHVCMQVTYVVNRNINYTNVCGLACGFCAFSKGKVSMPLPELCALLVRDALCSCRPCFLAALYSFTYTARLSALAHAVSKPFAHGALCRTHACECSPPCACRHIAQHACMYILLIMQAAEALRGAPYVVPYDEIRRRAAEAWARGATEVCMQGGIHPDFTGALRGLSHMQCQQQLWSYLLVY